MTSSPTSTADHSIPPEKRRVDATRSIELVGKILATVANRIRAGDLKDDNGENSRKKSHSGFRLKYK